MAELFIIGKAHKVEKKTVEAWLKDLFHLQKQILIGLKTMMKLLIYSTVIWKDLKKYMKCKKAENTVVYILVLKIFICICL